MIFPIIGKEQCAFLQNCSLSFSIQCCENFVRRSVTARMTLRDCILAQRSQRILYPYIDILINFLQVEAIRVIHAHE